MNSRGQEISGFEVIDKWGGYNRSCPEYSSSHLIICAKPATTKKSTKLFFDNTS